MPTPTSDETPKRITARFRAIVSGTALPPEEQDPLVEPIFAPTEDAPEWSSLPRTERTAALPFVGGDGSAAPSPDLFRQRPTYLMDSMESATPPLTSQAPSENWRLVWVTKSDGIGDEGCIDYRGTYIDNNGDDIVLEQKGDTVSARNLNNSSGIVLAYGSVTGQVLSMFNMLGQLRGSHIFWSDGTHWVRDTKMDSDISFQISEGLGTDIKNNDLVLPLSSIDPGIPGVVGIKGIWVTFHMEVGESFPALFSVFCLVIFATPVSLMVWACENASIQYWLIPSSTVYCLLIIPLAFVAVYIIHYVRKGPSRVLILFTIVGTASLLLVMGIAIQLKAVPLWTQLTSNDCDTFRGKRELQDNWDAAHVFYSECILNEALANNETAEVVMASMRIDDCPGYWEKFSSYSSWAYLATIEDDLQCAGWCDVESPLWTWDTVKDSCSNVVAVDIHSKGQYLMFEIMIYCVCLLASTILAIVFIGPAFKHNDIKW